MIEINPPKGTAVKAVILARVSSREQEEGYSIEAQKHRLIGYCQQRKLEILHIFEITESSTNGDRKKFTEMIEFAKKQKETIAIVADKIDRVQRSFKEYPVLDALIQEGKIELHFNTENYVIHKNSMSQERLMWSFGVIMAQSYVDNLRDNVKRSFDHKIRLGEYPSLAPLGYLNVRDSRGKSDIIPDANRAPYIRKLFSEYATGTRTLKELTKMAATWGLRTRQEKPLSKSSVHEILNNPFYYGVMRIRNEEHLHRYPPLIDKALFDQCRNIAKGYNKKPFQWGGKEFVFRGLLQCGVSGKTVTALEKTKQYKNGGTGRWVYLRCQCPDNPQKTLYIREEKILEQVEQAIRQLYIPKQTLEKVIAYVKETNVTERAFHQRQITELRKEQDRIRFKSDKLMDFLMDNLIGKEDYERRNTEFKQRLNEINIALSQHEKGNDTFKDTVLFLLDLSHSAIKLWEGSTVDEKRQLAGYLFENLTLKGATLCYTYKKPFCWFIACQKMEEWWDLLDSLRTQPKLRAAINLLVHHPPFKENL